jgi:pimeloyl-ACP methyl ester carboxylesterase
LGKVIAYTHGTGGVASDCAPSLVTNQAQQPLLFEGGGELLRAGYVVAASDYEGLGTPGPHPYLVGESEAMNELDVVRAARNLTEAHAGDEFVVWGHSQGGHASLFTGQLAAGYAPELRLLGVVAGAPMPNLADLFQVNIRTTVGKILIRWRCGPGRGSTTTQASTGSSAGARARWSAGSPGTASTPGGRSSPRCRARSR